METEPEITDAQILDWMEIDETNVTECLTHRRHLGLTMREAALFAIRARIRTGTYRQPLSKAVALEVVIPIMESLMNAMELRTFDSEAMAAAEKIVAEIKGRSA